MRVFKLRSKWIGGHVRMTIFSGAEMGTLANVGVLTMRLDEWELFVALFLGGAGRDPTARVVHEGIAQVYTDCERDRPGARKAKEEE